MPTRDHELPVELLRRNPGVIAKILFDAFGIEVAVELVSTSETFAELDPSTYVADLVLVGPDVTLVIEVQRGRDGDKRTRWPLYVASAHARTGTRTLLLVVALDEAVADWARRPIETFQDGTFRPIVIGPREIPRVVDLDQARALPELAVLSTLMHGRAEGALDVGLAGFAAAAEVAREDRDRGRLYADAVLAALSPEDMRTLLEAVMKNETFPYKSEFARENYERGMAEGEARGEARGEAKGVAAGKAEGLRTVLIALCRAHDIEWTDARASNVVALDTDTLERLIVRVSAERRWPDDA